MADFKEFKETAVKSGLGVILAYKMASETKYHIVCPLTTIPSIAGSKNTIDYSTTSNDSITKIPGKKTVNDVEITFPYTLDTVVIMDKISDQDVQYAIIDLTTGLGWKFIANASYRLNDVSPDNALEGTLQLTISDLEDQASDDMLANYQDTITFNGAIPDRVNITGTGTQTINVVTDPSNASLTCTTDGEGVATISNSSGAVTITGVAKGSTYVYIKATASDYASNQRKIYVVVK